MTELSTEYELMNGGLIRAEWDGQQVPVPPNWVQQRNKLPRRFRYAVLEKRTAGHYEPEVLEAAQRYVASWRIAALDGAGLVLTGDSGRGKTHAAAAVANEIVRLFGALQGVSVEWLPVSWKLPELFDHQHFHRGEEYGAMRRRILDCDILVVDDLLYAGQSAPVKEFLFGAYDYRYQKQKPIVTTMNADVTPEDWSAIESVFNAAFRRRLQETAKGFTVVL